MYFSECHSILNNTDKLGIKPCVILIRIVKMSLRWKKWPKCINRKH